MGKRKQFFKYVRGKSTVKKRVEVLDCTIRDGGGALYDFGVESGRKLYFTNEKIRNILQNLEKSEVDYVELGSVDYGRQGLEQYAVYPSLEEAVNSVPKRTEGNQKYTVFFRGPDTPIDEIPDKQDVSCDLIRMSIRYSQIKESLAYCKGLVEKGYQVSIQPTVTMRYTKEDISQIIEVANEIGAYAVYIVDSYGCITKKQLHEIFHQLDEGLEKAIRIGFHAHNNLNFATANAVDVLNIPTQRQIILDACCLGMGQGAGNLHTEVILNHLNHEYGTQYDLHAIIKACDELSEYLEDDVWGYSLATMLPACYGVAYKYGVMLKYKYQLSFSKIDQILAKVPEDMRYRYTDENLETLLKAEKI